MKADYLQDTIAVISTPMGKGAIAILRLSGDKALKTASRIFYNPKVDLLTSPPRFMHYGKIIDPLSQQLIDEVMLTHMPPESSFTREEVVEIYCHGGDVIPNTILKLLLSLGLRMAEPGEFTQRAYLNGRIDLTQAEAIHDIIDSQNQLASRIALSNLEKRFSKIIYGFRDSLVQILAKLEVNIDYPEEDLEPLYREEFQSTLESIIHETDRIVLDSQNGKIIKQGIKVAIVGKTNVGKSTLFNYLTREDRAIVSHIHGTTRDFLETHITLAGVPIELVDTAGFRVTNDDIEEIGKIRSQNKMSEADLILWVLDYNRPWDEGDDHVASSIKRVSPKEVIYVVNKTDLEKALDLEAESLSFQPERVFHISLKGNMGLSDMEKGFKSIFLKQDFSFNEQTVICNIRQESLLLQCQASLKKALSALSEGLSYEFIAIDLREALDSLSEIVGEVTTEDILTEIFNNFCIGK